MAPSNFKNVDWQKYELLSDSAPNSLTWASRGGDGSGKSYFSCTAPGPIFVCAFDPHGMSRVDKAVRQGKEIRVGRYGFNCAAHGKDRSVVGNAAEAVWNQFVAEYRVALLHCRSIIWDREDLAWELLRYASFGGQKNEGSKTAQLDYGDLNSEYVSLIQEAKAASVNLGLLQGIREKWVSKLDPTKGKYVSHNTGEMIPDGFKKVADHVDITIDHKWDDKQREYIVQLRKFPNKEEKDLEYPNLTFTDMALLAFPDSSIEDWQ